MVVVLYLTSLRSCYGFFSFLFRLHCPFGNTPPPSIPPSLPHSNGVGVPHYADIPAHTHTMYFCCGTNDLSQADPSGEEPRELAHNELLRDAAQGAPGLLEVDPTVTKRLLGSSRSEGCLLGTSKPPRKATNVVRAFRTKLRQVTSIRVLLLVLVRPTVERAVARCVML